MYTQKNSHFLKFQEGSVYDYKKTIILYLDRRQPSVSIKTTNVSRWQNQLNYACTLYTYYILYKHPYFFRLLVKKHKKNTWLFSLYKISDEKKTSSIRPRQRRGRPSPYYIRIYILHVIWVLSQSVFSKKTRARIFSLVTFFSCFSYAAVE